MKILGFAWAFGNPHSKDSRKGRRPEVWGCLGYKTNTALMDLDRMCELARNAASSSAQWDNDALPRLSRGTA